MKTWTNEDVTLLLSEYNKRTNDELMAMFPTHTLQGIYKKAYKMGLRKTLEIEWKNRSEARSGERSANWKGGMRFTRKGYRQVLDPGHPRADTAGYVMEHIKVWEEKTGLRIPDNCVIHHLNGNKLDNRIENLCLMERGAHTVFHHIGSVRSEEARKNIREGVRRGKNAKSNRNNG